eukprot:38199-Rhodomonas_salina.1
MLLLLLLQTTPTSVESKGKEKEKGGMLEWKSQQAKSRSVRSCICGSKQMGRARACKGNWAENGKGGRGEREGE